MRFLAFIVAVLLTVSAHAVTAWRYDPDTKVLVDPAGEPIPTGKEGELLPGANTTQVEPPKDQAGMARRWTGTEWEYVEDHRGKVYSKIDGSEWDMKQLGPVPDSYTASPRPAPEYVWNASQSQWVEDADLKRQLATPEAITPRQLLIGLMRSGLISEQEAVDAAKTGSVPAGIQKIFDALPTADDRTEAAITWAKMSVVERNNPLVASLAAANGMSEADVDNFFIMCSKI